MWISGPLQQPQYLMQKQQQQQQQQQHLPEIIIIKL